MARWDWKACSAALFRSLALNVPIASNVAGQLPGYSSMSDFIEPCSRVVIPFTCGARFTDFGAQTWIV